MSYAAMTGAAHRNGSPDRQTLCRMTDSLRAKATRALPEPERRSIASAQSFRVSGASAPSRLALDGSGCFGGPDPGQQFAEAAVGPVINELGQHVEQVGLRIDAVQFASLDQRGEHRPIFRPFVAAGEEWILAIKGNWSHLAVFRMRRNRSFCGTILSRHH